MQQILKSELNNNFPFYQETSAYRLEASQIQNANSWWMSHAHHAGPSDFQHEVSPRGLRNHKLPYVQTQWSWNYHQMTNLWNRLTYFLFVVMVFWAVLCSLKGVLGGF